MKSKTAKFNQAISRQTARDKRTANQQIVLLNSRPGNAKRERARLTKSTTVVAR